MPPNRHSRNRAYTSAQDPIITDVQARRRDKDKRKAARSIERKEEHAACGRRLKQFKKADAIEAKKKFRQIPVPHTFASPDGSDTRIRYGKTYSPALANIICQRIMMKESIVEICNDPRMPSYKLVVKWLADSRMAEFREMYYYAKRIQAEMYVDEAMNIADDSQNDWKPRYNKDGDIADWVGDSEVIQRSKLRVDTRLRLASKLIPEIYGERLNLEHGVTGDLAELLKAASNQTSGLPEPIDVTPEKKNG